MTLNGLNSGLSDPWLKWCLLDVSRPPLITTRSSANCATLDTLKAKFAATDVGYEKVQIFRMMLELKEPHEDDTFKKFVNETFHIENEYVMQLDPREFDSVPEFVVKECVRQVALMAAS